MEKVKMTRKKGLLLFCTVAILITACLVGTGVIVNNVITRRAESGNRGVAQCGNGAEFTCVVGDSTYNKIFDVRDLVRLERHFADEEQPYSLKKDSSLDCSLDGDWNLSGGYINEDASTEDTTVWDTEDADICFRMLVEETPWFQVKATRDSDDVRTYKKFYKKFKDLNSEFAYYTLNKELKQGWVLTFKVDLIENSDSNVSVYYPGCEDWLELGQQTTSTPGKVFSVVATEDIALRTLKIRVENSDVDPVDGFRIYDIQVTKHKYVTDLEIVYNEELYKGAAYSQVPQMPVVYGTKDTLDMTKFAVNATDDDGTVLDLAYNWELSYDDELVADFDITSEKAKVYTFEKAGTYTLTAKVKNNKNTTVDDIINGSKTNFSGEVSTTITVLDPAVYVNFTDKTLENINIGSASETITADVYGPSENFTEFVEPTTVNYTTGIDGDENGAINMIHNAGAYTVVNNYNFGTGDFIISTWFNAPSKHALPIEAAGAYLFGNDHPSTTSGFAVCLKQEYLRLQLNGTNEQVKVSYEENTWNHVVLRRVDDNLELYLNGKLLTTKQTKQNFDERALAFGGYPVWESKYHGNNMYFDDIQVYGGDLSDDVAEIILSPNAVEPDVEVNYDGGEIKNTGTNKDANAAAYQLSTDGSKFEDYSGEINYTTGVHGEHKGAIVTNHANAPYTVIKNHSLGTGDFTISTWFNIPDISELEAGSYAYLFGTANPTSATGFSVAVEKNGTLQVKVKADGTEIKPTNSEITISDFTENTWYHLAVRRYGTEWGVYLNGVKMHSMNIPVSDYDTQDIAFGAYTYTDTTVQYADNEVYFDDIEVYGNAKMDERIMNMYTSAARELDVYVDFNERTVENDGKKTNITIKSCQLLDGKGIDDNGKPNRNPVEYESAMFGAKPIIDSYFVTDFDGKTAASAFETNFRTGLYTVARDYVFGKDNFTVSTWFRIDDLRLYDAANVYLFGSNHPDATDGFSVCLKKRGTQQIRVSILGQEYWISLGLGYVQPEVAQAEWNNIALTREGDRMKVYLNDVLLRSYPIEEDIDFGTTDLSFGGYYGFETRYQDNRIYFDDIKVHEGALASNIGASIIATHLVEPDVEVKYTDGKIENTGLDRTPTVGSYVLNAETPKSATGFIETKKATFATGIDGDEKGAIVTNHNTGAYTVVDGYNLGRDDFTISTWFKMSNTDSNEAKLTYLFGIADADGKTNAKSFSVGIKKETGGTQGIRVKLGSETKWIRFTKNEDKIFANTWHHIAFVRVGDSIQVYLDGVQQTFSDDAKEQAIGNVNYGKVTLAFGGYHSYSESSYNNIDTHFDDVRVYGKALEDSYIVNVTRIGQLKNEWLEEGREKLTTLFIGDEYFTSEYWTDFEDIYYGKDVLLAGIAGSTTQDWGILIDRYLALTSPKNLVVHLGSNDIYKENGDDATTVIHNLQTFLTSVHELTNYKNTRIYYIGIPVEDNITETQKDTVEKVNVAMKEWCEQPAQSWITYVGDLASLNVSGIENKNSPEVEITYTGGKIENTGRNKNVTVGAYKLDTTPDSTEFVSTTASYTTGMEGDEDGAISMKHKSGAYTVVNDYSLGTNDFTISTWFNVPYSASEDVDTNAGTYILGNNHPGATDAGFGISLKKDQIRLRLNGVTKWINNISYTLDTWHNLVISRNGTTLKVYLNGTPLEFYENGSPVGDALTLDPDCDLGPRVLAFGGHYGFGSNYHGNKMYFDNIQIYNTALEEAYISYAVQAKRYAQDWVSEGSEMTTLFVGDDFFTEKSWGAFYDTYKGKDVKLAGIEGTTTYDWYVFADSYLAYTSPKNLVLHMGMNNIYDDGDDAQAAIQNLQALLTKIHELDNYSDTQIYYLGIPYSKDNVDDSYKEIVRNVNAAMKTWCEQEAQSWITYVGDLANATMASDYSLVTDALANAGIVIEDSGLNFDASTTYRTETTLTQTAKTVSTWIYMPTDYASRGGVIWGNYEKEAVPCVNYEINTNGNPRFYHINESGQIVDLTFTNVDICAGRWVNLTYVIEADGKTVSCYLNGELKQQRVADYGITLDAVSAVCTLGGDSRTDNTQYFKGRILELALYEDTLSAAQVNSLYTTGLGKTSVAPFTHYQLAMEGKGQDISDLKDAYDLIARGRYYTTKEPVTDYAYSFAVIGDPQFITIDDVNNGNQNLAKIYDWILANKTSKNIQYVFNMGDITDCNLPAEWAWAQEQNARMDGVVPYSVLRGNHDIVGYNKQGANGDGTYADYFNQYMGTDAYKSQFEGFYSADDVTNSWRTLTIGETKYLLLTLDWGVAPNNDTTTADAILAWAGDVITSHPDHKVVLTTHGFLNHDGTTLDVTEESAPSRAGGTYDGDDLWDKFVSQYKNIVLVMSGHIPSEKIVVSQMEGVHGNTVTSMLIDQQNVDGKEGSKGFVTMLYFSKDGKSIEVENYSTVEGKYFLESNQFTVEIAKPEVDIDFTGGTIANNGTDSSLTVGEYKLDTNKKFVDVTGDGEALFVEGRDGVANGALRLRHSLDYTNNDNQLVDGGAYVAVKGYDFGTDDFTLSTWFKVPGNDVVSTGAGTYLFGTNNPSATSGFSVCLKQDGIRIKAGNNTEKTYNLPADTSINDVWNQVVLCRRGGSLYLYLNGQSLNSGGYEIGGDYTIEKADLVFGGYSEWDKNYHTNVMHYDDIQVYHTGMTGDQIAAWYNNEK